MEGITFIVIPAFPAAAATEISSTSGKKNVYAKNLTVDAAAKHGSSALSVAAAASGAKISVASGDSVMRHKNNNTVSAKLEIAEEKPTFADFYRVGFISHMIRIPAK